MDFGKLATNAVSGATAGAALGPIGAGVGALLGVAPGLLSAIGVHIFDEGTAGAALDVIKTITGKSSPTAGDIAGLTPDQSVALQLGLAKIAADREKEEDDADAADRAADLNEVKAQLADIASARAQTVALAQSGSNIAWGAPVISVLVVLMFGGVLVALATRSIPAESRDLMQIMLGSLTVSFAGVVAYWIGSSAGSQRKDATVQTLAAKQ